VTGFSASFQALLRCTFNTATGILRGIDGICRIPAHATDRVAAGRKRNHRCAKSGDYGECLGSHSVLSGGMGQKIVSEWLVPPVERSKREKVHVIACGAIAREILAVCSQSGLHHIDLRCLPAIWHAYPHKIVPGLEAALAEARANGFETIFFAYADCGTGGELDRLCAREGLKRIEGPHCYSFFSGNVAFAARADDDVTSFFLTDFLARQFEAFVIVPLGLDRHPHLKDMYFGNYEKLVYLAQEEDEGLQAKARQAADYLGLAYEYRLTGYGDLPQALAAT
jgi:Protein of unknown function (DUF1638)